MAGATTTNQLPLLKRLFPSGVAEPLYKRSPFLNSIKKDTKFGGEGRHVNVTVGPTSGGSSDFATALANQGATTEVRFFVTHKKEYQLFSIQGDLIARSKGDKNAVLEAVTQQADKARYAFFRALTARAWGHAGGALGVISSGSTVSSTTITLATRANVVGFEPNSYVQLSSANGLSGSLRDSGRQIQLQNVNRKTGELTATVAWNTISGAATGDSIFRPGDFGNAMTGAQGWAPVSDPSASESFFGVDRTVYDIQRLSGIRVSGSGAPKEDTLITACAEAQLAGADGDGRMVHLNPLDLSDLVKELGSKRQYVDVKGREGIGFKALQIDAPGGAVIVASEPDVPKGNAWLVMSDEIYLRTAGEAPMMLNEDGVGKLMRSATDDSYQGRLGAYGNFFWENPGHVVVITW